MSRIGVFGGMGPSASADFMDVSELALIDGSAELAKASIGFAPARGWNRRGWDF